MKKNTSQLFFLFLALLSYFFWPFFFPRQTTIYASDAVYSWTEVLGAAGEDKGNAVAVDDSGNLYLVGVFTATIDFDLGTGVQNETSNGADIFIVIG